MGKKARGRVRPNSSKRYTEKHTDRLIISFEHEKLRRILKKIFGGAVELPEQTREVQKFSGLGVISASGCFQLTDGTRIAAPIASLPRHFTLVPYKGAKVYRECEVVWTDTRFVGVKFIKHAASQPK